MTNKTPPSASPEGLRELVSAILKAHALVLREEYNEPTAAPPADLPALTEMCPTCGEMYAKGIKCDLCTQPDLSQVTSTTPGCTDV